jgi:hypothetical protein
MFAKTGLPFSGGFRPAVEGDRENEDNRFENLILFADSLHYLVERYPSAMGIPPPARCFGPRGILSVIDRPHSIAGEESVCWLSERASVTLDGLNASSVEIRQSEIAPCLFEE